MLLCHENFYRRSHVGINLHKWMDRRTDRPGEIDFVPNPPTLIPLQSCKIHFVPNPQTLILLSIASRCVKLLPTNFYFFCKKNICLFALEFT